MFQPGSGPSSPRVVAAPRHGPPPKQRRSHATRARLVEAAIETLIEHGLAGASTPRIAERAHVSQGALFKHFPTKDAILAAAVEAMLRDFVDDFTASMHRALTPAGPDAPALAIGELVTPACAALWRIFRTPEMRATFEVYIAARTDDAIAARLGPILDRHRGAILREARRLFPQHADGTTFEAAVDAIVYSMQGAALGLFAPRPDLEVEHLAFLERLARRELGLEPGPTAPAALLAPNASPAPNAPLTPVTTGADPATVTASTPAHARRAPRRRGS